MKKALVLVLALAVAVPLFAAPEVKFSGYQWYRYELKYTGVTEASSKFYVARTYITTDVADTVNAYAAKLTLDINNLGTQSASITGNTTSGYAVGSSLDWAIWIKLAYVDFNALIPVPDMKLRAGLQGVYYGTGDKWGYQLFPVPFNDNFGMSSADMGVALVGSAFDKFAEYEVAVYNGTGYKKVDTDFEKAVVANLKLNIFDWLSVRGSWMHEYKKTVAGCVLFFKAFGIDGYAEYDSGAVKAAEPGKSGVAEGLSFYAGAPIIGPVSMHVRYDTFNPDTMVKRDEWNKYIAGINIEAAEKKILLQLDYELLMPKYYEPSTAALAKNSNTFLAQLKWVW